MLPEVNCSSANSSPAGPPRPSLSPPPSASSSATVTTRPRPRTCARSRRATVITSGKVISATAREVVMPASSTPKKATK